MSLGLSQSHGPKRWAHPSAARNPGGLFLAGIGSVAKPLGLPYERGGWFAGEYGLYGSIEISLENGCLFGKLEFIDPL